MGDNSVLRIGVLASGRGSNFQSIIDAINKKTLKAQIVLLVTDNPSAFAVERAKKNNIECLIFSPQDFSSRERIYAKIAQELKNREVHLVVLAGFMRIVGKPLIDAFRNRIMNIHPAILPSFSGLHGQKQAIEYGVKISGCTVHFVDEGMDTGPIIIQAAVPVSYDDSEETLAERILNMEHKIYPEAVRLFSEGRLEVDGRIVKIKGISPKDAAISNPPVKD
jgi:phosphoribosylglycinamide formyltransferase-1